jgi:hypothetical protein
MEFFKFLKPRLPGMDITAIDTVNGEPLLRKVREKYASRTFGGDFAEIEKRFIGGGSPMSGGRGPTRKFAGDKESTVYAIPASYERSRKNAPEIANDNEITDVA